MDGNNHERNGRLMRVSYTKGLSIPVMSTRIDQFMRTIASIIGC